MLRTEVDHSIEVLKSRFLQNAGIHVIFKMAVIKWESDAVQPEAAEEGRIGIHEEVFQKLVEEKIGLFLTNSLSQGIADLEFATRIP